MIQNAAIDQEEVMRNLNKLASSTNETDNLFDTSMNYLTDYYKIDVVMIYLYDKDTGKAHLVGKKNVPARYVDSSSQIDGSKGKLWDVIAKNTSINVKNIQEDDSFNFDLQSMNKKGLWVSPFHLAIQVKHRERSGYSVMMNIIMIHIKIKHFYIWLIK
jgi:hypothetical protein